FVRVVETIDQNGEVKRAGECLLGVWPSPLYETSTCNQYVQKGTFTAKPQPVTRTRTARPVVRLPQAPGARREISFELPEELLDMNADEFREVLREVIRDELGVADVELGGRWQGGEVIMKPGKE